MGLIKAAAGAIGSTMADQWKEFFYCDAIDKDTLVVKGTKRITSRSSNTKSSDNVISNGSGIAVADGQCMIIVDQGKIVEVCAEPGQFTYDTSAEPSVFSGPLGKAIVDTFKLIGRRFTLGGDTGRDQRVYYFNTKEITDNKFGTANPIPFRVVDRNIGLDLDTAVRCNGVYSYRLTNPLLFYTNVCGNVERDYSREEIDSQLKAEFISALQPAFAKLALLEMRPNQIPAHAEELSAFMNETLTRKWGEMRGISIVSIGMNSITIPDEDAEGILTGAPIAREYNMQDVYRSREDIRALELGVKIYDEKAKVARSSMMPNLALVGTYSFSNPNVFNGFKNRFNGMFSVGAVLTVPIWHWGGNYNKYRAAKAQTLAAQLELDNAKDLVDLQVNQASFKAQEALKTYRMTESNLEEADENLRCADVGFRDGVMTIDNVMEAQTAWLKAHSENIDARIDIYLCDVYLSKVLGQLAVGN